jgi:hypothetical protein
MTLLRHSEINLATFYVFYFNHLNTRMAEWLRPSLIIQALSPAVASLSRPTKRRPAAGWIVI